MNFILNIRLLAGMAFYIFIPFFALYIKNVKILNENSAALLTMILIFSSRAFSLVAFYLINRLNNFRTIMVCYIVCIISLAIIVITQIFSLILICTIAIGAGFAIGSIAIKNIVAEAEPDKVFKLFIYLNIMINLASALGTIIGSYIQKYNLTFLPIVTSTIMFLSLILLSIYYCKHGFSNHNSGQNVIEKVLIIENNQRLFIWIGFLISSITPLFFYGIFFDAVSYQIAKNSYQINPALLSSINAIIIIILQNQVYKIIKDFSLTRIIKLTFLVQLILGLLMLVYNLSSLIFMIGFVILFTFCEMIWSPVNDYLSSKLSPFPKKSTSISISNFLWGLAESVGACVGVKATHNLTILITIIIMLLSVIGNGLILKHNRVKEIN